MRSIARLRLACLVLAAAVPLRAEVFTPQHVAAPAYEIDYGTP